MTQYQQHMNYNYFETIIVMFTVLVLINLLVITLGNCPLYRSGIVPLGNGLVNLLPFIRVCLFLGFP